MPLDELLRWVDACGLTLYLKDDGLPSVKGPRERLSPELLAALKEHKTEVVEWLQPQLPRRIVIVFSMFGEPQQVLSHESADGFVGKVRQAAAANPTETVAGEWLRERAGEFRRSWIRFMWISPNGRERCDAGRSPSESKPPS